MFDLLSCTISYSLAVHKQFNSVTHAVLALYPCYVTYIQTNPSVMNIIIIFITDGFVRIYVHITGI